MLTSQPEPHLLDEIAKPLGAFDVFSPRSGATRGFCLSFNEPFFEPLRTQIADSIVRIADCDDIVIGLAFWEHPRSLNPEQAFALLARHGVGVEDRWNTRRLSSEPDSPTCQFASQSIAVSQAVAHVLAEMVTRMDFGTWEQLAAELYVWNRRAKVLVRYWDDRGADVLCRDPLQLAACAQWLGPLVDIDLTAIVWGSRRIQ